MWILLLFVAMVELQVHFRQESKSFVNKYVFTRMLEDKIWHVFPGQSMCLAVHAYAELFPTAERQS